MNRRTFLLAGSGVLAVQAAPSDQVNLGVIGSGGLGTFVMTVFQKNRRYVSLRILSRTTVVQ